MGESKTLKDVMQEALPSGVWDDLCGVISAETGIPLHVLDGSEATVVDVAAFWRALFSESGEGTDSDVSE